MPDASLPTSEAAQLKDQSDGNVGFVTALELAERERVAISPSPRMRLVLEARASTGPMGPSHGSWRSRAERTDDRREEERHAGRRRSR